MREGFRQSMDWLHSWAGLVIGWLLFAIAATGTASVWKGEIDTWMRPEVIASAPAADALGAAVDELRRIAPKSHAWYLTAPDDRLPMTMAGFEQNETYRLAAMDPVTGREVSRETFGGEFLYRFHFELHVPYPWGRWVASAAAMALLVVLIAGIVVHRRIFADFFTLRTGKGKRSWLDAHNVLGVLPLPFHLMIAFTGIVTLVTMNLPWALVANYGTDMERAFAEVAPGFVHREQTGKPAPVGDVRAMVRDAEARMGGRVGRVSIEHPGDSSTIVTIARHDGDQLSYGPTMLAYDGPTGRLINAYTEARPAKQAYDVLYGLHMGRFGPGFTRWLYFLCGLALCATIATGLVLWSRSREKGRSAGHWLVARVTPGTVGGVPLAIACFFLANRLLPAGLAGRADLEVRAFFLAWLAATIAALLLRPRAGWAALGAANAAAWGLLPIVSAITTTRGLPASVARGDWMFAAFDLVALAFAAIAGWIAWRNMAPPASPMRAPRLATA